MDEFEKQARLPFSKPPPFIKKTLDVVRLKYYWLTKFQQYCLEQIQSSLFAGARVLDIGSGSGFTTAILYELVKAKGIKGPQVVSVEHD